MTFSLICCAILILLFVMYKRNFDYTYWKRRKVPFIAPTLFFGNFMSVLTFRTALGDALVSLYRAIETPFFGIFILNKPYLIVKDPDLIKTILIKDFPIFSDRSMLTNEKNDPIMSKILFSAKNPEWKYLRHKVSPLFTSSKLKNVPKLLLEPIDDLLAYLDKNRDSEFIKAKTLCAKYTIDVISSYAFGIRTRSFSAEETEFMRAGNEMMEFSFKNGISQISYFVAHGLVKTFKLSFFIESAINFLKEVFWETLKQRKLSKTKRHDLIDIMIEIQEETSSKDEDRFEGDVVVAQAIQYFVAGFEPASTVMSFALFELSINPDAQTRLREEIHRTISEQGELTYESVLKMNYLNMVLCETIRKYPVFSFLDRICLEDYQIPDTSIIIEKGTPIFIPVLPLHRDPKYFPDPEKFDPDRFSEENQNGFDKSAYFPFGDGPRRCIGEKFGVLIVKFGLAQIIARYEVAPCARTRVPIELEKKCFLVTAADGVPVRFKKCIQTNL